MVQLDTRPIVQVAARVGQRAGVTLDAGHRAVRTHARGEGGREQADAAVQVEGPLARAGPELLEDDLDEGARRGRVHLPEAGSGDPEVPLLLPQPDRFAQPGPPAHALEGAVRTGHGQRGVDVRQLGPPGASAGGHDGQPLARLRAGGDLDPLDPGPGPSKVPDPVDLGVADRAVVHGDDVVAAVPVVPEAPLIVDAVLDPGPPAQPLRVAGQLLDGHLEVQAGQPPELLGDHVRLQPTLGGRTGVLPVAPSAPAGSGERARRVDPVGGAVQHLDGVGPQIARTPTALGDPGPDPLTGQGVPDEHHSPVEPGDAVTSVGDRSDEQLDDAPDQGAFGRQLGIRGVASVPMGPPAGPVGSSGGSGCSPTVPLPAPGAPR